MMKTHAKTIGDLVKNTNSPLIMKKDGVNIDSLNYRVDNRDHIIQIEMSDIQIDNYRVYLNGRYLTLIISQPKELSKPIYSHNLNLYYYFHQDYEVMRSIDIWLPGSNFYLLKHFLVPDTHTLNVYLRKLHFN